MIIRIVLCTFTVSDSPNCVQSIPNFAKPRPRYMPFADSVAEQLKRKIKMNRNRILYMEKGILLIIYIIFTFSVNAQEKDFTIKGKIISCSEYKVHPFGYIYLYKDSVVIDSIATYHSLPDFFGGWAWTSGKFKFKGIKGGEYQIRYDSYFDEQDYPKVLVSEKNIKNLKICFDKLPERLYEKETILDNLKDGDTLFINVYIASFGEFGGYDEGFWITKEKNQYIGRFYRLPNTYALQYNIDAILKAYSQKAEIKPLTDDFLLSKQMIIEINRFLIEIERYKESWISNAPEHFLIYDKSKQIFKVKNHSRYRPYMSLKNKMINGI